LALDSLRQARERRGLTQEQLAARAGMTRAAIANLERGMSRARVTSATRLAEVLGVSLEVLSGQQPIPMDEAGDNGVLTDYLVAAMRQAVYRHVGERHIYATVPGMPGLWARGATHDKAARDLRQALEWWVLTAVFEHRALPAYDDASLQIIEEDAAGERVVYAATVANDASFADLAADDTADSEHP